METLRQGSRAVPVKLLQRLLNKKGAYPQLTEDGIFGHLTAEAVREFQLRAGLGPNGVAGRTTWTALGLAIDIAHNVQLVPQAIGDSCWNAAAATILGFAPPGVPGATLLPAVAAQPGPDDVRDFAAQLGWRFHFPQRWAVSGLAGLLYRRPAWAAGGGSAPTGSWLHAIVISALWSDGADDGSGTLIRIHDPLPPNVGAVYGRFYQSTPDGFDFLSLYVLQPN